MQTGERRRPSGADPKAAGRIGLRVVQLKRHAGGLLQGKRTHHDSVGRRLLLRIRCRWISNHKVSLKAGSAATSGTFASFEMEETSSRRAVCSEKKFVALAGQGPKMTATRREVPPARRGEAGPTSRADAALCDHQGHQWPSLRHAASFTTQYPWRKGRRLVC